MATVDVSVGGRAYQLACENGQEAHLRALAAMVDAEVKGLSRSMGAVGEGKLLLMAALIIADKLNDAGHAAPADPGDAAALTAAMARLDGLLASRGA